ncbi:hypothetical protein D5086_010029 [Populus alba]|uniref:Uncharacterized protein n=1 Tax=Populus alba TaxID=43335 RepID=A0ACC4C8I2_POPAL
MHCFYAFGFVLAFHGVAIGLYAKFYPVWCVSPRLTKDRERFPPNNILFRLFGAGLLWMSWTCFNGGDPCVVSTDASLAVLNTVDFEQFPYEDVIDYSQFCISVCTSNVVEKFLLNPIRSTKNDEWARMWKRLKEVENFSEFQYPSREGDVIQMIWQVVVRKGTEAQSYWEDMEGTTKSRNRSVHANLCS